MQDAERTEKVSKRVHELDIVYNNVKLLNDMLQNHQPGFATQSDKEIMKVMHLCVSSQICDAMVVCMLAFVLVRSFSVVDAVLEL
jgi:hypothetical protein